MIRKIKEWISVQVAKNPGRVVLFGILLFNIVFFFFAAFIISRMSLDGTENMPFLQAAFSTITMILDPGCVQFVVNDIGQMGVSVALICLAIIFVGMVSFTGAVIGYVTNTISSFIGSANSGKRSLKISNHVVILNWNTRASEIVNDLMFCEKKQKVVVLVNEGKEEIEKEIADRLTDTARRETREAREKYGKHAKKFKPDITVIVREGDVFSSKQLHDISLERAKIIVILGSDYDDTDCKYEHEEIVDDNNKGNSHTVKTLMQVADIAGSQYSADGQRIVVEITDNWTKDLVDRIIKCKQVKGRCNIIPVNINTILGQILSQFSLMPELNFVYRDLFSNKGTSFYSNECEPVSDSVFIPKYLKNHASAIPLTSMKNSNEKYYSYFTANKQQSINLTSGIPESDYKVKLNYDYWIEKKTVIILGHNSRCKDIMMGFCNFRDEWNYPDGSEILNITVIDDKKSLEEMDYYRGYPFPVETVEANIFEREKICSNINRIVSANDEDTSILILSDDKAPKKDIDANALANLVYVQDIINEKIATIENFDRESIDVVVEIIDPKHHDIVNSYSVNNVVISNRFVSKMITQIGEKEAIFEFYNDILTYDSEDAEELNNKEVYAKKVCEFFDEIPAPCTAAELIRAVYEASMNKALPEDERYETIILGYVKPGGKMVLFSGDQTQIDVKLEPRDKIIMYTIH